MRGHQTVSCLGVRWVGPLLSRGPLQTSVADLAADTSSSWPLSWGRSLLAAWAVEAEEGKWGRSESNAAPPPPILPCPGCRCLSCLCLLLLQLRQLAEGAEWDPLPGSPMSASALALPPPLTLQRGRQLWRGQPAWATDTGPCAEARMSFVPGLLALLSSPVPGLISAISLPACHL